MPDSLRYLIILGLAGGIIYGGAWWLSQKPPGQQEVVKHLSNDKLQK